jgi:hypothetical protein
LQILGWPENYAAQKNVACFVPPSVTKKKRFMAPTLGRKQKKSFWAKLKNIRRWGLSGWIYGATTLVIMGLFATLSIKDIKHHSTASMLSVAFYLLLC